MAFRLITCMLPVAQNGSLWGVRVHALEGLFGSGGAGAHGQPPPLQTSPPLRRMGAVSPKAARTFSEMAFRLITCMMPGPRMAHCEGGPQDEGADLLSPVSCSGGPLWVRCWTHAGRTRAFQVTCLEGEPFKHPLPLPGGAVSQKAARTPLLRNGLGAHHLNDAGCAKWLIVRGSPG